MSAFPGSSFVSDCKVIVDSIQLGRHAAVGAGSTHARIYALLFTAFDDTPVENIVWMPAHQDDGKAKVRTKSNGTPLTQQDIDANDLADRLAKRGIEDHRVPYRVRQEWLRCRETTMARAKWIARATYEANNLPAYPFSDSESSRKAAEEAKKKRARDIADGIIPPKAAKTKGKKTTASARPPALGGHTLEEHSRSSERAWRCTLCRQVSAAWNSFAPARCPGSAAVKWASKAVTAADKEANTGPGHQRVISGDIVWCRSCGCFADAMARGLAGPCRGKPGSANSGGRFAQLRRLRSGRHPVSRELLPPAIDEEGKCMLYDRTVGVTDLQLQAKRGGKLATGPLACPTATASSYTSGTSAAEKMRQRPERVRVKERKTTNVSAVDPAGPVLRRLRGKQRSSTRRQVVIGDDSAVIRCEPCGIARPRSPLTEALVGGRTDEARG